MSKKDFSVALKYVEARPRSQRRKGAEARVSGISVVGSGVSATDLSLLQANLISVTNNFTALKDLFDSMFEKDSEGNIHAKLSLWSSGGITAGGVGSGGSGGGGISYNRLDSWADYSADKAGYVLSALLGKDLDNRVSALANAGYITASYLAPYALRSEIPSLVGYATQSWVGDNYLSKSGGVITGQGDTRYVQLRLDGEMATVMFQQRGIEKGAVGWGSAIGVRLQNTNEYGLAVTDSNYPIFYWGENGSVQRILLHAGNYSNYALPITGGRISGDLKLTSREVGNDNAHSGKLIFAGANNDYGNNDYKMGPYIQAINIGGWGKKKISFFQRDWSVEGFDADPEEVFSIMPNGNILIGSTEDSGEKLQVNGNVKANNFIGNLTPSSGLLTVTGQANITTSLTTPVINTNTLKVGNITLVEENSALKVIGGLVATGGVTSGEKAS